MANICFNTYIFKFSTAEKARTFIEFINKIPYNEDVEWRGRAGRDIAAAAGANLDEKVFAEFVDDVCEGDAVQEVIVSSTSKNVPCPHCWLAVVHKFDEDAQFTYVAEEGMCGIFASNDEEFLRSHPKCERRGICGWIN